MNERKQDMLQDEAGGKKPGAVLLRRDVQIVLGLLAAAALLFVLLQRPAAGERAEAVIYVGNREYRRVALGEPQTIVIEQEGGKVNEIAIDGQGVHMARSTCKNQDCVKQGEVTPHNYNERPLSTWIICLPNQISIELVVEEDG